MYGATKLCADKLFAAANNVVGKKKISFSVLRYGNVLHSRVLVLPLLIEKLKNNQNFKITDEKMTRFIELDQAIDLSIECLKNMIGGEIFVPKLKSYKILDLANALNKKNKIEFIGIRPGEKLHEEMISKIDSLNTYDLGKKFAIIDPASEKLKKTIANIKK